MKERYRRADCTDEGRGGLYKPDLRIERKESQTKEKEIKRKKLGTIQTTTTRGTTRRRAKGSLGSSN
jgi:hypothetical protein